jgi:digeranylgeranylglycerophospholipid reductase
LDDVIVVGAGPAGNNAARGLADQGYAVTVIDWRENIGDKPCTGIVGRECVQRFPINPAHVYREARSANLVSPEDQCTPLETKNPQACIIDRVSYVASIAQSAQSAGAGYRLGERVLRVLPDDRGVSVVTDQGSYRARSVVLAAGFGSALTRQLGLGAVSDYVPAIQATVATTDISEVEIYLGQEMAPGFFSWLVPTAPGLALAGLLTRRKAPAHLVKFLQYLKDRGRIIEVVKEPASWGVPLRPLRRTYRDRVLVVGDAAGQVKPTTGGGIYYSLLASQIAVDVLDEALGADDLSSASLSRYQSRWRDLLSHELETGYSARRVYEFLTDQQISSLIRHAGANGVYQDLASSAESAFDWHSQLIGRLLNHPGISGVLRLVNPLLAKLAPPSDLALAFAPSLPRGTDPLARTPG